MILYVCCHLINVSTRFILQTFNEREGSHELAMFGHVTMLTIDEAMKRKKRADDDALTREKNRIDFMKRDPRELAAKQVRDNVN